MIVAPHPKRTFVERLEIETVREAIGRDLAVGAEPDRTGEPDGDEREARRELPDR